MNFSTFDVIWSCTRDAPLPEAEQAAIQQNNGHFCRERPHREAKIGHIGSISAHRKLLPVFQFYFRFGVRNETEVGPVVKDSNSGRQSPFLGIFVLFWPFWVENGAQNCFWFLFSLQVRVPGVQLGQKRQISMGVFLLPVTNPHLYYYLR